MEIQLKRVVRHRSFLALVAILLFWGGFGLYNSIAAPGRIAPSLQQAITQQRFITRVAVNFDFGPEEFHINYLQNYGSVAGVQGNRVMLIQVSSDNVREMSKLYWIRLIELVE